MQLDIFNDSRDVMLRNDVVTALAALDGGVVPDRLFDAAPAEHASGHGPRILGQGRGSRVAASLPFEDGLQGDHAQGAAAVLFDVEHRERVDDLESGCQW